MKVAIVEPLARDPLKRLEMSTKLASAIQKTGVDVTCFRITTRGKSYVGYDGDVKVAFSAPTIFPLKPPRFLSSAHFFWWSVKYERAPIYYKSALSLLLEVKKYNPDVIHFRGFYLSSLFSLPLSRIFSIPTVIEPLDVLYMQNPIRNAITRALLKGATKIFAWGEERLGPMVHDYKIPKEKIVPIPSVGVNEKEFFPLNKEVCRKELNLDENYRYLLLVSFIMPKGFIKNPYESLHVLKKLNEGKKRYKLIVVGSGEVKEYIDEAKKLGVSQDIVMAGFVDLPKLNTYYNAADVFLWPFSYGGPGIGAALTEAMACGLPAVAYSYSKFRPTDEDCILYVPDEDRNAMAGKVAEIFEKNELRKRLSQNSLKRVKMYTFSNIAKKAKEEYQKILESAYDEI
jgi:glycosyltransferase involved in cell wall biosynthesis